MVIKLSNRFEYISIICGANYRTTLGRPSLPSVLGSRSPAI
jgi:hypothetical protein